METPSLSMKLSSLNVLSQHKLQDILKQCGDKKDLIIDPALIKPLERICGVTWLRQHGIEKIYKMDPLLNSTANIIKVYMITACSLKFKRVLEQISSWLPKSPTSSKSCCFYIIIIPKIPAYFESQLESRGLFDVVKMHSLTWDLMTFDEGVLSLELPFLFKQVFVNHDTTLLSSISMSLFNLFQVTGKPDIIFSVGKHSASIIDILEIYSESFYRNYSENKNHDFSVAIVIDRDQDFVSSLLTPATYSGLLHETFPINCGQVELNVSSTKIKKGQIEFENIADDINAKHPIMTLDSRIDSLYGEIRHRHFSEVLSVLSTKAKLLKNEDIKALGIQEIKHFVATKLQQITAFKQNLVNHVLACETIISEMSNKFEQLKSTETDMITNRNKKSNFTFLQEHFGTDSHVYNSLRLMCLLSLSQGLVYDEYNILVNFYLNSFGHKYLYVFQNLINTGLLIQPSTLKLSLNISNISSISDRLPKFSSNTFQTVANKLKQIPANNEESSETTPSYVFNGGYIPLVASICSHLLNSETFSEAVTKLSPILDLKIGGKVLEKIKPGMETLEEKISSVNYNSDLEFGCKDPKAFASYLKSDPNFGKLFPLKPRSLLVYVVGGVTYAEIAACEVVQINTASKIYIASDCLSCGSDLMKSCF